MSKPRRYRPRPGNLRTEMTTAWGVQAAVDAAKQINARTRAFNYHHREDVRYAKARAKITMPLAVDAWLKKEV